MVAVAPAVASWSDGVPVRSAPLAGAIQGIVFDSLVANAPLAGAEVTIEGTELAVLTDRGGRFRFDSVPQGRMVLRFYHARLDSLGFGAAPVSVVVAGAGIVDVRLATPSPSTFYAGLCPTKPAPSTGALLGIVRDVDDRRPLPDATVEIAWTEWTFDHGMVRKDRRDSVSTNANGAYALCGVPTDVPIAARAAAGDHVTGAVEIEFEARLFAVRDFAVSLTDSGTSVAQMARLESAAARGDSMPPTGTASVRGTVRRADGTVVDGAQIAMSGFPAMARTGGSGAFAITAMPAGTQSIEIRALGYVPRRLTLDLRSGEHRDIDVRLDRGAGQSLAPVTIVGRGASYDRTGYSMRLRAGVGEFVTPERIASLAPSRTTDLLRYVRGVRVTSNKIMLPTPVGAGITQTGGVLSATGLSTQCSPAFWVDGFFVGDQDDVNGIVRPSDIRGIEVYVDPANAPVIYRRSDIACGIILIWTKPPAPRRSN